MQKAKKERLRLQYDAKILLIIAALFTIAIGLSNTFVNVFIWRIKKDFAAIGVFNLFIHIATPLTFILAGFISKKHDGTIAIRTGVIIHTIYFLTILLFKEKAAEYLIPLGIFLGIAAGFYWLGFHVLSFDLTNDMNRDTFYSYNGLINALAGMFAPLTAGIIISSMVQLRGYYLIFGLSFTIFLVIIYISFLLHTHKTSNKFKLIDIIKTSSSGYNSIIIGTFFFGIRNGVIMFLINLLIFITLQSELSIGKITLLGALISAISFQITETVMKPVRRKLFIWLGTIMMFISVAVLIFEINLKTLIIFTVINSLFYPFFIVPFSAAGYNLIDSSNKSTERIEYIIYKELALNVGRIIGIIVFVFFVNNKTSLSSLKYLLVIIGSVQLAVPLLIKSINKDGQVI